MNEGESATDLRVIFNSKHYNTQMIQNQIHITPTHVLAYETQKWSKLQTARIHKFCTEFL